MPRLQIVVSQKVEREIKALAKSENRSVSSMAGHLMALGKERLFEQRVHKDARYPEKVKAPRVCAPCYEVDIYGNPVTGGGA